MSPAYPQVDATCTTVEENQQYAKLPPDTKGYLAEKVDTALKTPRHVMAKTKVGTVIDMFLMQVVMSSAIRVDEAKHDFFWRYKAEVSFDMTPVRKGSAPMPFLSSSLRPDPNRRHSTNPFPQTALSEVVRRPEILIPGSVRRPDVILVRNPLLRWPGRGIVDHEDRPHTDNLLRLVEVKFAGDGWGDGQENAYRQIAGGTDRMSVLDVSDCDGDLEKARQRVRQLGAQPSATRSPLRAPVRTARALPGPVWYEDWIQDVERLPAQAARAIESLWADTQRGVAEVSTGAQAWLRTQVPWLHEGGRWTKVLGQFIYEWVDAQGHTLHRFAQRELLAMWRNVQRATDLTWEVFTQVQWTQLVTTFIDAHGAEMLAFVLVVAGVAIVVVAAPVIVTTLTVLQSLMAAGVGGLGLLFAANQLAGA